MTTLPTEVKPVTTVIFALKNVKLDVPNILQNMYEQVRQAALQSASTTINGALERHVDAGLGRAPYVRRRRVGGTAILRCQRCGSRARGHFSRNG